MKKLVVMIGLPGAGKSTFCRKQSDWVIVSKTDICRMMFRATHAPGYDEAVEQIFASALVEAVDSQAEVVCVDNGNLTRAERAVLVEVGKLAGREVVAHVMATADVDALHERTRRNLRRLAMEDPTLQVVRFPRESFNALAESFEEIEPFEGFSRILHEESEPLAEAGAKKKGTATRRSKPESRDPLPLFVS